MALWQYEKFRAKRIDTGQNTLLNTLAIALSVPQTTAMPFPANTFGIVSLHRFENIFILRRLAQIIRLLEKAAERFPLVFVLHPATRKKLVQFGLLSRHESNSRIKLLPRMGYIEFVRLMQGAKFIITDGGSNQEELSYLGIPTLLISEATERQEGLATTAILCANNEQIFERFLRDLPGLSPVKPRINLESPSKTIVDYLEPRASPPPLGIG